MHDIEFSYSVRWVSTTVTHGERMNRYAQYSFLPQSFEIHWLSIINSFVLVLLLTGFLSIILMRVLKNDFTRYASTEDDDEEEETGWKLLHGDVFRLPPMLSVFCAYVGTGVQLFSLIVFLLILAVMNTFYPGNRGAMYTAAIVLYALTAGTAGFVSAHLYCRLSGSEAGQWAWNLVLSGTLFPAPMFLMFSFLNTVAIAYNSQTALPFGTILVIICIWALVTLPLTGHRHSQASPLIESNAEGGRAVGRGVLRRVCDVRRQLGTSFAETFLRCVRCSDWRHHRAESGQGQGSVRTVQNKQDPSRDTSHPVVSPRCRSPLTFHD